MLLETNARSLQITPCKNQTIKQNVQENRKIPNKMPTCNIMCETEFKKKQIDSLNRIRGKRLPFNLGNGSSIYIDDENYSAFIKNLAKKSEREKNAKKLTEQNGIITTYA
jgi:hypothetical protein